MDDQDSLPDRTVHHVTPGGVTAGGFSPSASAHVSPGGATAGGTSPTVHVRVGGATSAAIAGGTVAVGTMAAADTLTPPSGGPFTWVSADTYVVAEQAVSSAAGLVADHTLPGAPFTGIAVGMTMAVILERERRRREAK